MSARNGRVTRLRPRSDVGEELMGAADAIADMAQRVQLNGPEPTYASEKLSHALYMAAEGLALLRVVAPIGCSHRASAPRRGSERARRVTGGQASWPISSLWTSGKAAVACRRNLDRSRRR